MKGQNSLWESLGKCDLRNSGLFRVNTTTLSTYTTLNHGGWYWYRSIWFLLRDGQTFLFRERCSHMVTNSHITITLFIFLQVLFLLYSILQPLCCCRQETQTKALTTSDQGFFCRPLYLHYENDALKWVTFMALRNKVPDISLFKLFKTEQT